MTTLKETDSLNLAPNEAVMLRHLKALFGESMMGFVEIAYGNPGPTKANRFSVSQLEAAAAFAANVNLGRQNVYIGVAPRETGKNTRGKRSECMPSDFAFVDIDDGATPEGIVNAYDRLKPAFQVITGRHPNDRTHLYFRLEDSIGDNAKLETVNAGLISHFGGDEKANGIERLLRLAGSVAWPSKEGRIPEMVELEIVDPSPRSNTALEREYPAPDLPKPTAEIVPLYKTLPDHGCFAKFRKLTDGRKARIVELVWANGCEFFETHNRVPATDELADLVLPEAWRECLYDTEEECAEIVCEKVRYAVESGRLAKHFQEQEKGHGSCESAPSTLVAPIPFVLRDPTSLPPRQWLYDNRLIRGRVSVTLAPGGIGKSILTIVEGLAMATGRDLFSTGRLEKPLKVWIWNLEDPEDELEKRFTATCMYHNIVQEDFEGRFLFNSMDQSLVITHTDRNGTTILEPVIKHLVDTIKHLRIDILVIDPFVSSHDGSENDNMVMDRVAKAWCRVANEANCAIELVHHTKKLGGAAVTTESSRGASAITNAARNVRVLNQMTQDEGAKAGVDNHRLYFRAVNDKSNLAPPSKGSTWYRLESVHLGNCTLGLGDSVGVAIPWKWPNATDDVTPGTILKVQRALSNGEFRGSDQSPDWAGYEIGRVVGFATDTPTGKYKAKTLLKTWVESNALKKVHRKERGKQVPYIEVGEWMAQ